MRSTVNQMPEYLYASYLAFPKKVALVFNQQRLSYEELHHESNQLARYLMNKGLNRGERVVVSLGNCIETILLFWAVLKVGGVISIVSPDLSEDKLNFIIKDSGCKLYFTSENSHEIFNKKYLSDIAGEISNSILDIDLAAIIYTSGSTGEPKGVMLTHRNMIAALESINTYLGNTADEVILSALPLSFDYGLYQMLMAVSVGGRLILEKDFLLPLQFVRKISQEKVTAIPGVPTLFSILNQAYAHFPFDTTSVRYVTNTGAAVYEHHVNYIQKIFQQAKFYSMYGLTECKRCTYLPPEDLLKKPGSVGKAIPNTEMWIVDDNGHRLPANTLGQLVIRGATVMQGYWNKPLETNSKLKAGKYPNEKVLYTGDYGVLDDDGYFYFKGRMDEEIKSRGVKVSPREIEDVLNAIEWVQEAAVLGVPHPTLGNEIVAFVVGSHDKYSANAIIDICQHKLERQKIPHRIFQLKALPKSSNGKIDKQQLKSQVIAC